MSVNPLSVQPGCNSRAWYDQTTGVRHFEFKRHFTRPAASNAAITEHVSELRSGRYHAASDNHELHVEAQSFKVEYDGPVVKLHVTAGFQRYRLTTGAHENNWYQHTADYEPNRGSDPAQSGQCLEDICFSNDKFLIDLRPVFSGAGDPVCGFAGADNNPINLLPTLAAPSSSDRSLVSTHSNGTLTTSRSQSVQPSIPISVQHNDYGVPPPALLRLWAQMQKHPQSFGNIIKRMKTSPEIQGDRIEEVHTSEEEDVSDSDSISSGSDSGGDESDEDSLFVGSSSHNSKKGKSKSHASSSSSNKKKKKSKKRSKRDYVDLTGDDEDGLTEAQTAMVDMLVDMQREMRQMMKAQKKDKKKREGEGKSKKKSKKKEKYREFDESEDVDDEDYEEDERERRHRHKGSSSKKSKKHSKRR